MNSSETSAMQRKGTVATTGGTLFLDVRPFPAKSKVCFPPSHLKLSGFEFLGEQTVFLGYYGYINWFCFPSTTPLAVTLPGFRSPAPLEPWLRRDKSDKDPNVRKHFATGVDESDESDESVQVKHFADQR